MKRPSSTVEMSSRKKPNLVESSPLAGGIEVNAINCSKVSDADLHALAGELGLADAFAQANLCNKLQVVAEQMQTLAAQAREIVAETRRSAELNRAACNFVKQAGHVYHLYRRPTGQLYFGMLSPDEWSGSCPHEHVGSYRYEFDRSYTPVADIHRKDGLMKLLRAYGMDKMLT